MSKEEYLSKLKIMLSDENMDNNYSQKCISYAERLLDNGLPVIFDMKHFSLLMGIEYKDLIKMIYAKEQFYSMHYIPKKNGSSRQLLIPAVRLKTVQRWILDKLLININVSEYAMGFCKKKSIKTNAESHLDKECVLNMDMKDFFPSIKYKYIFKIFAYYGYAKEVSYALATLCTFRGSLPQGAPTSPSLSNIVCLRLDKRLSKLANCYNANYSRYADDITFSGDSNIVDCKFYITKIVNEEDFDINDKKTRIAYKHQRQEVTGIIVNDARLRVNKKYKRKIYQEIYYCTKYGVLNHMIQTNCDKAFYKEHLYGKAFFINMIEPDEGKKLLILLQNISWDY